MQDVSSEIQLHILPTQPFCKGCLHHLLQSGFLFEREIMSKENLLEVFKKNLEYDYVRTTLDVFLALPPKAQELIWAVEADERTAHWLEVTECLNDGNIDRMTPIEKIFYIAFSIYTELTGTRSIGEVVIFSTPLLTQHPVFVGEKKYIPDFIFDGAIAENPYVEYDEWDDDSIKDIKIIIECDGHEFHKATKEQVARDNERELDLKMHGYDVIRFSGSQIYNEPMKCAEKAYTYIKNKIEQKLTEARG